MSLFAAEAAGSAYEQARARSVEALLEIERADGWPYLEDLASGVAFDLGLSSEQAGQLIRELRSEFPPRAA